MSYVDHIAKAKSEKLITGWIEPKARLIVWTLHSGAVYVRDVNHYLIDLKLNTTSLVKGSSTSLNPGEFYYDPKESKAYVRMSDDSNPNANYLVGYFRLFYANKPINLPSDMSTGGVVYYNGILDGPGTFKQELDEEAQGITLEISSNLSLINSGGIFKDIYDRYVWKNAKVTIFSFESVENIADKRTLFNGQVDGKNYSEDKVGFNIKDFATKLKDPLKLPLFNQGDGTLASSTIGRPKRRIYGEADGVKLTPIDVVLGEEPGYTLGGTFSGLINTTTIEGVSSDLLNELSPEDTIIIVGPLETVEREVGQVIDEDTFTITDELPFTISATSLKVKPKVPYRKFNRRFHICGHKLYEFNTTITEVIQANRIRVVSVRSLRAGDKIKVNGELAYIKRISNDVIVLLSNLQNPVSIGQSVTRVPIKNLTFTGDINKGTKIIEDRDFTYTTNLSDTYIDLDELAEFNFTKSFKILEDIDFTNGSREITGNIDFKAQGFKSRDWIKSNDLTHAVWYEILEVQETKLILREPYGGVSVTSDDTSFKKVEYIAENSLILADIIGLENSSGEYVDNAPRVIKDLLLNDAELDSALLNLSAFDQAEAEGAYTMSLVLPLDASSNSVPAIRDVINIVNDSVIGSLVNDFDYKIAYNILSARKPNDMATLKETDIINYSVNARGRIYGNIKARYSHFDADRFTGEPGAKVEEFNSLFVANEVEVSESKDVDVRLYNRADAEILAQRYGFIHSLSSSIIRVNGPLALSKYVLNDKLIIDFNSMFTRYGGGKAPRIMVVIGAETDGESASLILSDLGNIFNRSATITDNSAASYTSASEDEILINGYIVDNTTALIDNNEDTLGINLIS